MEIESNGKSPHDSSLIIFVVMVLDDTRAAKEEPVYEGPLIVKSRTSNGDF